MRRNYYFILLIFLFAIFNTKLNAQSVKGVDAATVLIPQGISPNGDGLNDNFKLNQLANTTGIDIFQVYDRRGVLVYEKDDYVDEFVGKDDDGNDLPAATYYYVIKLLDGKKITGWFQLIR